MNDPNRTGAHEPDPDITQIRPQDAAAPVGGVAVAGFEIESTLGRGGMGVVYKAKQTGLNRVVALKMLLAGQFADPNLRARFLLEAESVAALEHPGIVKVYTVDQTADGHPYLAMEFVPGGTLADRIKANGPLPATAATELLAKLADAVAHAHSRGVVHRDIKPLNVLLTAEGEPRLTDFGLAKVGRAEQNLSVTGQVLGTPAYMAPEQAAGKVREVGTAADVYALGAVLYDVLTGRPPFSGDSQAVTLHKVINEEPLRPRKHNPAIPHDLETICLKCLEKDPAKRYPTAQALAADLLRYLRNEPISVRPAGALERGYKWVKRNKVVAGAMAAVSLALLVGASVSLGFGLEANKQAKEAKKKKQEADSANALSQQNESIAKREKQDAIKARNELQVTLARLLLAPLSADPSVKRVTPYEENALWQLTEMQGTTIGPVFLDEATRTALTRMQLANRASLALHAAIGLDRLRIDATNQLLGSRLSEARNQEDKGVALARVIAQADFTSPTVSKAAALVLAEACDNERDEYTHRFRASELVLTAQRLEPDQAAQLCARVAPRLIDTVTSRTDYPDWTPDRYDTAQVLAEVARQMKPAEAARLLVEAIDKTEDPSIRSKLADILSQVARRMEPNEAAEVCARVARHLVRALNTKFERKPPTGFRSELAESLSRLTWQMKPVAAARSLVEVLEIEKDEPVARRLAVALSEVANRMELSEASRVCAPVARILPDLLDKHKAEFRRDASADDPPRVMGREAAVKEAQRLIAEIIDSADTGVTRGGQPFDPLGCAERLVVVAGQMEPALGEETRVRAACLLFRAIPEQPFAGNRQYYAAGLRILTVGLPFSTVNRSGCATYLATGAFSTPHNVLPSLVLLYPHFQPQPRPLPPQALVELLKHPFCVGEARRAVLDALEFTYKRPFKDQWEFVEYAQKHQPQLDLLTPPKRPEARP